MTRRLRSTVALAIAVVATAAIVAAMPAAATPTASSVQSTTTAKSLDLFPTEIALPNAWLPEGIAIGVLPFAFFGSRADGDLYRVNLITGEGSVFSQGPGTPSVGLKVDLRARLFVAGGSGGDARVVNAITGEILASYAFGNAPTFVNDVVLTPKAAWFTDSQQPFLYKVPFGRFGRLPSQSEVEEVPLGGRMDERGRQRDRPHPRRGRAARHPVVDRVPLPRRSGDGRCHASRPRRHSAAQRRRAAPLGPHAVRGAEPTQSGRCRGAELRRGRRARSPST